MIKEKKKEKDSHKKGERERQSIKTFQLLSSRNKNGSNEEREKGENPGTYGSSIIMKLLECLRTGPRDIGQKARSDSRPISGTGKQGDSVTRRGIR